MFWRKNRASIIKKALPSVVSILEMKDSGTLQKDMNGKLTPLVFPFGTSSIHAEAIIGSGSGFFVDASGLIITSRHVIRDAQHHLVVVTTDGAHLPATIVSIDPIDDISILKVEGEGHSPLKLGDSSRVALGEEVITLGNALGLFENTVSSGIISGVGRAVTMKNDGVSPIQELRGLIQTDAAINTGNSGGPLINMKGVVIGINTFVIAESQNLSFAVPINSAKRDLEDIRRYGTIKLPFLGLHYVVIDEALQKSMDLSISQGALVTRQGPHQRAVVENSPAKRAGIVENDIIISVDNKPVTQSHNIQDILEEHAIGDVLRFRVARGNQELNIETTLAERPRH